MFEKFGEFDSAEELNKTAAGLKAEGDMESLVLLAVENGLDKEDAEDYMDGCMEELANPLMAAQGKLNVEEKELQPYGIMIDWLSYIRATCMEHEEMQAAVRRTGKSLKDCMAALLTYSLKNAKPVDNDIMKKAGVNGNCKLGIPDMGKAKEIIKKYYLGA